MNADIHIFPTASAYVARAVDQYGTEPLFDLADQLRDRRAGTYRAGDLTVYVAPKRRVPRQNRRGRHHTTRHREVVV